jgi:hypothetical protein
MGHNSIDLDHGTALATTHACTACRSNDLRPVCGDRGLLFLCPDCRRTWVPELGALLPADLPVPPAGAPARARRRGAA